MRPKSFMMASAHVQRILPDNVVIFSDTAMKLYLNAFHSFISNINTNLFPKYHGMEVANGSR
jgi:hypothetical protein